MSNYEFFGRKMARQPERRCDSVQGCGNPTCSICLPGNGQQSDVRLGGGGSGSISSDLLSEMYRNAMRDLYFSPSGFRAVDFSQSAPSRDEKYEAAREKIKKYILETEHSVAWNDVIGNEAARIALIEAIEHPITHAELYKRYGKKPLKGIMLYGPPGCGKTMFGKAAAAVIAKLHGKKAMLLKINGPEIQTPYVGQTEEIIRNIFAFAREYRRVNGHPLTIFIDEADAILPARDGPRSAPWEASNVAAFLAEMDGVETSGAFVILATNRPDAIDAALLRDGRCDRKIKVERPDCDAAEQILANALRDAPLSGAMGLDEIVREAIVDIFSPYNVIGTFVRVSAGGQDTLSLMLSHILNGAMLVGLVDRAKGIAFRRDLAGGTITGVCLEDMRAAVAEIVRENQGLNHAYALQELAERVPIHAPDRRALQ